MMASHPFLEASRIARARQSAGGTVGAGGEEGTLCDGASTARDAGPDKIASSGSRPGCGEGGRFGQGDIAWKARRNWGWKDGLRCMRGIWRGYGNRAIGGADGGVSCLLGGGPAIALGRGTNSSGRGPGGRPAAARPTPQMFRVREPLYELRWLRYSLRKTSGGKRRIGALIRIVFRGTV